LEAYAQLKMEKILNHALAAMMEKVTAHSLKEILQFRI
jgi:hypothetical protein